MYSWIGGGELEGQLSNFCCNEDLQQPRHPPAAKQARDITKRVGSLELDARNIAYMKLVILMNNKHTYKIHKIRTQKKITITKKYQTKPQTQLFPIYHCLFIIIKQKKRYKKKVVKEMYIKIQLKLSTLHLRLKQQIPIQIGIKKQQESIIIPKISVLENCIASLNSQVQFQMPLQNPCFQICVMLLYNGEKKFVGFVKVYIKDIDEGILSHFCPKLEKSPDKDASLQFSMVYRLLYDVYGRQSTACNKMEDNIQEVANQIQTSNHNLLTQNYKLQLQLQTLKQSNAALQSNRNDTTQNFRKCVQNYQQRNHQPNLNTPLNFQNSSTNICSLPYSNASSDSNQNFQSQPTFSQAQVSHNPNNSTFKQTLKIMNEQQYLSSMEQKMVKLKMLVDMHGKQDIRDRVQDIFKKS